MRRKWILGALLCSLSATSALLAQANGAQVEMSRRADGVYVFSNNPDKPRPPMVGMARKPDSMSPWRATATVPAHLRDRIFDHALARDLDPKLVEALIRVESAFNARAISNKGAMGLMQLMPDTATELGVENALDVDQNLRGGTTYLKSLLDRFSGDLSLALAGYNAGPGAVEKYRGIPPYPETTEYVRRVLAAYGTAPAAKSARKSSPAPAGTLRIDVPATVAVSAAVAAPAVASGAGR